MSAAACLVGARVAQGVCLISIIPLTDEQTTVQIYLEAPAGFSTAMTATIGSRLILNIRDARKSHRPFVDPVNVPVSNEILIISKRSLQA